ncbi:DUF4282 domain-containing protein [Flagellatimonas centrodinii]|uniref:DUF4282 domain-containing protein n=1 Tax=Flagellatimonas centrodinii TaxID=2806210 RepID=UPI001FF035E9|nr:DUF4282 domain-containing protein [Flagellatimonas centrodinii]ULQ45402.1 DUF4282 domain-containing protein [Flagellatimonas centrodinii]
MTEPDDTPAAAWRLSTARDTLRAIFDPSFERYATTRVVPMLFLLGVGLAALSALYRVIEAFSEGALPGLLWLLLLGPAQFVGISLLIRILLELCVAIFRLASAIEDVILIAHRIEGQTGDIASDLPRIQFWKPRRRTE